MKDFGELNRQAHYVQNKKEDIKMDEKQKTEAVSNVKSIKQYFESGTHGRPVNLQELRKMTPEDRAEL